MYSAHLSRRAQPRTLSLLGFLVSGLMGCASSMTAQTAQAFPAAMYRRAAEAVQGESAKYSYFIALATEHPYEVLAVRTDRHAAEEAARRTNRRYGVIGPVEGEQKIGWILGPCKHRPDSYISCPDTTMHISVRPPDSLQRIIIVFQMADGSDTVMAFTPDSGDAVFFTLSAMEKFVFPYYERIFGLETANRMREEYVKEYGRP